MDVLFYVLPSDTQAQLDHFLVKLIKKMHKQSRQADILVADNDQADHLSERIWAAAPDAFIANSIAQALPAPFQLWPQPPTPQTAGADVVVNLDPQLDPTTLVETLSYQRRVEVLDQSEQRIALGRTRWRAYQRLGLTPTVHKL